MKTKNVLSTTAGLALVSLLFMLVTAEPGSKKQIQKGQTVYATSNNQPLRNKPAILGAVETRVNRDEPLNVTRVKKKWIRVKTQNDSAGWLQKRDLTTSPPEEQERQKTSAEERKQKFLQRWRSYLESHEVKFSEEAKTATTTGGVRGLNPQDQQNYSDIEGDFDALKEIELMSQFLEEENAVDPFRKEGGLR